MLVFDSFIPSHTDITYLCFSAEQYTVSKKTGQITIDGMVLHLFCTATKVPYHVRHSEHIPPCQYSIKYIFLKRTNVLLGQD